MLRISVAPIFISRKVISELKATFLILIATEILNINRLNRLYDTQVSEEDRTNDTQGRLDTSTELCSKMYNVKCSCEACTYVQTIECTCSFIVSFVAIVLWTNCIAKALGIMILKSVPTMPSLLLFDGISSVMSFKKILRTDEHSVWPDLTSYSL